MNGDLLLPVFPLFVGPSVLEVVVLDDLVSLLKLHVAVFTFAHCFFRRLGTESLCEVSLESDLIDESLLARRASGTDGFQMNTDEFISLFEAFFLSSC